MDKKRFVPQRAVDTSERHLEDLLKKGPLWVFIKHDGVRGLVKDRCLLGKSMTMHNNLCVNQIYSQEEYEGMDGELINKVLPASANDEVNALPWDVNYNKKNSVHLTSSLLNTINTDPSNTDVFWFVFDYYDPNLTLRQRYDILRQKMVKTNKERMSIVDYVEVKTLREILDIEKQVLANGYEGLVIRNPELKYKEGKSSYDGELLRLKRYITAEMVVTGIKVMKANNNVATVNALGRSKRSSHAAYKVDMPNIGSFSGHCVQDIMDPYDGSLLVKAGTPMECSATSMPRDANARLYKIKDALIGQIVKFKFFPKGIKDKPRFATYECFVSGADFSPIEAERPKLNVSIKIKDFYKDLSTMTTELLELAKYVNEVPIGNYIYDDFILALVKKINNETVSDEVCSRLESYLSDLELMAANIPSTVSLLNIALESIIKIRTKWEYYKAEGELEHKRKFLIVQLEFLKNDRPNTVINYFKEEGYDLSWDPLMDIPEDIDPSFIGVF